MTKAPAAPMDAFLSYRKEDAALAHRLASDLELAGTTVWSDHTAIRPGEDWAGKIERAISAARSVIFIIPERERDGSLWQSSEIALAVSSQRSDPNKRIIPINAHSGAELPFFLKRYQALDMSSESAYKKGLQSLILAVKEDMPPDSWTENDRAWEELLSAQKEVLAQAVEDMARTSSALHKSFIVATMSAVLAVMAAAVVVLSAFSTGWIGELSITSVFAVVFGAIVAILGTRLFDKIEGQLSSLLGRSEDRDQ